MPVSENKPSENKPAEVKPEELKPATSPAPESKQDGDKNEVGGSLKIEEPSYGKAYAAAINSPQLNNQINVYGEGPGEEPEAQRKIRELNEKSSDVLTAAGSSADADVHTLLGHRTVAVQNGDVAEVERIDKAIADGRVQSSVSLLK